MNVETVPLVYEANDECCASFGGGRIANTNNGANSKVHYFLIDHSGCKRVVAKGMPMSRIYLDHQITIPSVTIPITVPKNPKDGAIAMNNVIQEHPFSK